MNDTTSEKTQKQTVPKPKGHRLWMPATLAVLALVGVLVIRGQAELERNLKDWATTTVLMLAGLLGLMWFLFLSRLGWKLRLGTAVGLALLGLGLSKSLRVDGVVDGTGLPKLVWRWSSLSMKPALAATPPTPAAGTNTLNTVAAPEGAADVPQFFGPQRDGAVKGAGLATDWSSRPPKQLWRKPVGHGWSAFAVVGGLAYTQEQIGEDECVTCYTLATGTLVWKHADKARFDQWQGGDGPRATPTVHEGKVFTLGATGILNCLDAGTGQRVWSREVLGENKLPNIIWGISASPLVYDDTVVVTGGMSSGPTVLAYRRSSGEPLWKSGTDKASYSSPVLATLAGKRVVLSFNAASLTANDASTGELLLNQPWSDDKWPKASQPVVLEGDRVFVSAGYGAGCELLQIKAGSDGKLGATRIWKNLRMKTQFNSVSVRDGHFYGLDDGLLACVEIATGERKWKDGRFGSGQTLLVDDLILIQSEPGAVVLAEASPTAYKELGRIPALDGKTWNHPTLAGRYLLVRNSDEMACYELPVKSRGVDSVQQPAGLTTEK